MEERWIAQIDALTREFKAAFGALTVGQLNFKPGPDSWSIAQTIDHLVKVNSSYLDVLDQVKGEHYRPPFLSRFGFLVRAMGNMILKSVQPGHPKKVRTFPAWEPGKSNLPVEVLHQLVDNHYLLKKAISGLEPLLDKHLVIASPAHPNIVYRLDTALDIIVAHERRHLQQAMQVLSLSEKSSL